MHRTTSLTLLVLLFLTVSISLVSAQQCGPDQGSCDSGFCCSAAGFCGNTVFHCGRGCQPDYGSCGNSSPSPSSSSSTDTSFTTTTSSSTSNPFPPSFTPTTSTDFPTTTFFPTTTTTTETTTTTTKTSRTRHTTTTKGTFQLQPTGKLSGAIASQDKGGVVQSSTVALAVVFVACMMML